MVLKETDINNQKVIDWLLTGDVSIQYQVFRDLLSIKRDDLQARIEQEGWGVQFLSKRKPEGHWGKRFYQPKWTSSHYTLLDLKNLEVSPGNDLIRQSILKIVKEQKSIDGGINPHTEIKESDVCINGMFMNYACYFGIHQEHLHSVVDCVLSQLMPDGGFNCRSNRSGATHSSLHTTLSILEGIWEYEKNGYQYRLEDLMEARNLSREFILIHQLFISDRTGEVINKAFTRFPYPPRWKYDILRALDYFQYSGVEWDERMKPAIDVLLSKKKSNGRWKLNAKYPGQVHFEMEKAGQPSRWNTLRGLRVLKYYIKYI